MSIGWGKLNQLLKRAATAFAAAAMTLSVVWILAVTTDWLDIAHGKSAGSPELAARDMGVPKDPIEESVVSQTTRGKAVFRTLRLIQPRQVDDTGRYLLTGVSTRDGVLRAYIKDTKLNKTHTVYVGTTLSNRYEVIGISRDGVELRSGNNVIRLRK